MRFTQFYLESLGHASYFVGAEDSGEALVLVLLAGGWFLLTYLRDRVETTGVAI